MPEPFSMVVTLTIAPERRDAFVAALEAVLPSARGEDANRYLHVGQAADDDHVFVLAEGWRDKTEYLQEILERPYFKRYLEVSEAAYAVPREVRLLQPVSPEDPR